MVQTTVAQPASVDPVAVKLPHVPSQQSVLDVNKVDEQNSPGAPHTTKSYHGGRWPRPACFWLICLHS